MLYGDVSASLIERSERLMAAQERLGGELLQVRLGRKASRLVLRVGQPAVDHDVELAGLADLCVDGTASLRFKPSLHTEDFGFVASRSAVMDNDGHVDVACSKTVWRPPAADPLPLILSVI